jgi:hypothetical protein
MKSQMHTSKCQNRCRFIGSRGARIMVSADEAALARLRRGQNAQKRSQGCLGVTTEDPRHSAHAAKSSTVQAPRLRPIRVKDSRAGHRQRQTAAKLTTFMAHIRRFMEASAILLQKLYAHLSEHAFDQGNRILVSRAATLDILERISMKTGRLNQVPNRQIERSTRHPNLCACQQARNAKQSNQGGSK